MRRRRVRAWWKQFNWARNQRKIEAREFCTYRNYYRWAQIKVLNDMSHVWKKR